MNLTGLSTVCEFLKKCSDIFVTTFGKIIPMKTKTMHTVVVIPNNKKLEILYYCSDTKLQEKEKENFTNLVMQLQDCHSLIKIPRLKIENADAIEAIVQKTVINARGHLCD